MLELVRRPKTFIGLTVASLGLVALQGLARTTGGFRKPMNRNEACRVLNVRPSELQPSL